MELAGHTEGRNERSPPKFKSEPLCQAVLDHGMLRRSPLLSGPLHPWVFIEEAANKEVERDFRSVYSRLVLCKTFR